LVDGELSSSSIVVKPRFFIAARPHKATKMWRTVSKIPRKRQAQRVVDPRLMRRLKRDDFRIAPAAKVFPPGVQSSQHKEKTTLIKIPDTCVPSNWPPEIPHPDGPTDTHRDDQHR